MHVESVLQDQLELLDLRRVLLAPRLDRAGEHGHVACLIDMPRRDEVRLGEDTLQGCLDEARQGGVLGMHGGGVLCDHRRVFRVRLVAISGLVSEGCECLVL